jgi:16S rRNA (cytosine967-C5)-methyltransferase
MTRRAGASRVLVADGAGRGPAHRSRTSRTGPRALALRALQRIDDGAYANLALPGLLDRSGLALADRGLVTELVYGTTRMRRACDWLVDRFLVKPPDPLTRAALRLGAYQLEFLRTPPHAAVDETVAVTPGRTRGLANAVLRRVADAGHPGEGGAPGWPGDAVRLSYPDWIVERLVADLGRGRALGALEAMNVGGVATTRADGYVQDRASQWVAAALQPGPGERVVDLCAAPGGKATAMAEAGPRLVVAIDVRAARAAVIAENANRLGTRAVVTVVADGTSPPLRPGCADRVLVDAPCSGLGVLHRRPDARWRIGVQDVSSLAALQRRLLDAAIALVAPGGLLAFSVCTLTTEETTDVDRWMAERLPALRSLPPPGPPWEPAGRGARLLPQAAGTDGMFLLLLGRP